MDKRSRLILMLAGFVFSAMGLVYGADVKDISSRAGQPTEGRIIFVTGSCSCGKSSTAKILAKKLNAQSFAFDERVMPVVLKKFIEKHYGKFLAFFINKIFMRNFFSSVDFLSEKKKHEFQLKFYRDLKAGLAVKPTSKMYREARMVAKTGQDVVVESPLFLWEGVDCLQSLDEFKGANITYVLAYCPWQEVIERLKKRNASANKKNHRELDWVIINFMHNFDVTPNYCGENYLESVEGRDVQNVIKKYAQRQYKKRRLHLAAETQQVALQKFPQYDMDYYIYPRFTYDLIINTKLHKPEERANLVIDYLQQKKAARR